MRLRLAIGGMALLAALLVAWAVRQAPARADSYMYSVQKREMKVCVLLIDSFWPTDLDGDWVRDYDELENADPHTFYVLDSRVDIKPRGWELINPLAPRFVDDKIRTRWLRLDPVHPYELGQRVTKDMACYWEVYLNDVSVEDLLQYDLILLTSHMSTGTDLDGAALPGPNRTNVEFTAEDNQRLRQLVDMGGTIWIEDCWLMRIDKMAPFFIPDLNFQGRSLAGYGGKPANSGIVADRYHPLLNSPYRLTAEEVNRLGDKNVDDYRITNLMGNAPPDPVLFPVVMNAGVYNGLPAGSFPYIAGSRFGGGRILVTSGDTSCDVNDWIQEPPSFTQQVLNVQRPDRNGGAYCGRDLWRAPAEDLKFCYNALNWAQGETNYRKDPRRTGFTRDQISPPLEALWQVPLPANFRLSAPPVIWRNMAFFAAEDAGGNTRVYAVDGRPQEDRDGDGNPNDGTPGLIDSQGATIYDLTPGAPYDVIWEYPGPNDPPLTGRPTALHLATVTRPNPNTNRLEPVDGLFFTTEGGSVYALDAMPEVASTGLLAGSTTGLWTVMVGAGPSTPVVSRGLLYTTSRAQVGAEWHYTLNCMNAGTGGPPLPWYSEPAVGINGPMSIDMVTRGSQIGEVDVLPPVATALVRNEAKGASDDVVYATLPSGVVMGLPVRVWGEAASPFPPGTVPAPQTNQLKLDYYWADPEYDLNQTPAPQQYRSYRPSIRVYGAPPRPDGRPWYYSPEAPLGGATGSTLGLRTRNFTNAVTGAQNLETCIELYDPNNGDAPWAIPQGARVVVDYCVDLRTGITNIQRQFGCTGFNNVRPDNADTMSPARTPVLSGPAVGSDDNVYFATGNGMVYALADRGGGGNGAGDRSKVLWRYGLNTYRPTANTVDGFRPQGYVRELADSWAPGLRSGNVWVPLPPAVDDRLVYVAMNRPNANGTDGAVFALSRKVTAYVQLPPTIATTTGTASGAEWLRRNLAKNPPPKVFQYSPEAYAAPGGPNQHPHQSYWAEFNKDYWSVDLQRNRLVIKSFGASLMINPSLPVYVDFDGDNTAGLRDTGLPPPNQVVPASALPFYLQVETDGAANRQAGAWGNLVWRYPSREERVPVDATTDRPIPRQSADSPRVRWDLGVASPPTISGGVLYIGTADGRLFALDADPRDGSMSPDNVEPYNRVVIRDDGWADHDPQYAFRDGTNGPNNGEMPGWRRDPRVDPYLLNPAPPAAPLGADPPLYPPDVLWVWNPQQGMDPTLDVQIPGGVTATTDMVCVAANSANQAILPGVYALASPVYAVGDASRMVKASAQGRVLWVMNEVIRRTAQNIGGATYGGTPQSLVLTTQKALNRPQSATALSADTVLISDTGNDRVIATDQTGTIAWEASEIYDPLGILPAGEFKTDQVGYNSVSMRVSRLSTPTDAVQWVSYEAWDQIAQRWSVTVRHTLIADAGNYRVIEVVDKFRLGESEFMRLDGQPSVGPPPAGVPLWYHVVVWASATNVGHRDPWGRWQPAQKYRYTSVQPVLAARLQGETAGSEFYTKRALVTVGNYALSRAGRNRQQRSGASLLFLESGVRNPVGTALPDPAVGRNYLSFVVDDPAGPPGYLSLIANPANPATPRKMDRPATIRRFRFTRQGNVDIWHDLYADATGIYEWVVPADGSLPAVLDPGLQQWTIVNDPTTVYSQFWQETYRDVMARWQGAAPGMNVPNQFDPTAFQFQPASVSRMATGGWLVANRVLDRTLSNVLAQAGRAEDTRRVQVFTLRSDPRPGLPLQVAGLMGDYDPGDFQAGPGGHARFGFSQVIGAQNPTESIRLLFGPRLSDLGTGRDLGIDLVNPMYAVRAE